MTTTRLSDQRESFARTFKEEGNDDASLLFFDTDKPISFGQANGRMDVYGGIADYSGSLVLELLISESTHVSVQPTDDDLIKVVSIRQQQGQQEHQDGFDMQLASIVGRSYKEVCEYFSKQEQHRWASYVIGVFVVLMHEKGIQFTRGAKILIQSCVPEGKGVSSSAALEVATMRAVCAAYDALVEQAELATLCQLVEHRVANAPCGIMDQATVVHGRTNKLFALECQPAIQKGYIDIPHHKIKFWGIDSGVRHSVSAGSSYADVRTAAFMGLAIIAASKSHDAKEEYLANITPSEYTSRHRDDLPENMLGSEFLKTYGETSDPITTVDPNKIYAVRQCTEHPIYENYRAKLFSSLVEYISWKQDDEDTTARHSLGELMYQSHVSYSKCGLGSPETDRLVELVRKEAAAQEQQSVLYGARITGGGSGGTVVVLGRSDEVGEEAIHHIAKTYFSETGHDPYIFSMDC